MNIFRIFLSKKIMQLYSKTHQIAPFNNIFLGKHFPKPLQPARGTPQATLWHEDRQKSWPPWQILHMPMVSRHINSQGSNPWDL